MTASFLYVEVFTTNNNKPIIGKIKTSIFDEFLDNPVKDWLVVRSNEHPSIVFRDDIEKIIIYRKIKVMWLTDN